MKKRISLMLAVAMLLSLMAISPAGANALTDPALIVDENFDSGVNTLITSSGGGTLTVENGALYIRKENDMFVSDMLAGQTLTDFIMEFDFKPGNPDYTSEGIAFRDVAVVGDDSPDWGNYILNIFGNEATTPAKIVLKKETAPVPKGEIDLGVLKAVWYTIKIVAAGNIIRIYAFEKENPDKVSSIYYEEPVPTYSASGDIRFNSWDTNCFYDNIKIYNSVASELSAEDYGNLEPIKSYTFDEDEEDIGAAWGDVVWDEQSESLKIGSGAQAGARTNGWSKDLQLADFTAIFDYKVTNETWSTDRLYFHMIDETNIWFSYFLGITGNTEEGAARLTLSRRDGQVGSDEIVTALATAWVSALKAGTVYRVKLEVKNNVFKVYFGEKTQGIQQTPTLAAVGDPVFQPIGEIALDKWDGFTYIDNLVIYDTTDRALVDDEGLVDYYNFSDNVTPFSLRDGSTGQLKAAANRLAMSFTAGSTTESDALLEAPLRDFTFKTDYMRGNDFWGISSIFFRAQNHANGYTVSLTANEGAPSIEINKFAAGAKTVLASSPLPSNWDLNKKYVLEITTKGYAIQVYFYAKGAARPSLPTVSAVDTAYGSGNFFLATWDTVSYYDNMAFVKDLEPKVITGAQAVGGQLNVPFNENTTDYTLTVDYKATEAAVEFDLFAGVVVLQGDGFVKGLFTKYQAVDKTITATIVYDGTGQKEYNFHLVRDALVSGDAGIDGQIDVTDLVFMKKHAVGADTLSGKAFAAADMNDDEDITAADITALKKALLHIVDTEASLPLGVAHTSTVDTLDNTEDYWPAGISNAKIVLLQHSGDRNGELIAVATRGYKDITRNAFYVYRSIDEGQTWSTVSLIRGNSDLGMSWMPELFELPVAVGGMPAGTLVLSGVAIDANHQQSIMEFYKSTDGGASWEFMSNIAQAPAKELSGYWEPNFYMTADGKLACYYVNGFVSDDINHKIVMKTTEDGYTWSNEIECVKSNTALIRPGMPVVTRMGNGQYIMALEVVEMQANGVTPKDPTAKIFYKTSVDGINWGDITDMGAPIGNNNNYLASGPWIAWTPLNGGTLFTTAQNQRINGNFPSTGSGFLVSTDVYNTFTTMECPLPHTNTPGMGYANGFTFSPDGKIMYMTRIVNHATGSEYGKFMFAKVVLG